MLETTLILLKVCDYDRHIVTAVRTVLSMLSIYPFDVNQHLVVLKEDDLIGIYPHVPTEILNAQIAMYAGRPLTLFMVRGEGAIMQVYHLKGSNNNTEQCKRYTLRHRLGELLGHRTINLMGPDRKLFPAYENYVHVPNRDEVARDRRILMRRII